MPYTRAVLKEGMRISPVLAGNARQTGRNIVLNGYQVPEGVCTRAFYQANASNYNCCFFFS